MNFWQRLEFLGDSVLDLLITWHLYQNHTDVDPGELTDLRSASVNNENFAQVAVRRNLYQHLLHGSGLLQGQIAEYVKVISESENNTMSLLCIKAPKVSHGDHRVVYKIELLMSLLLEFLLHCVWNHYNIKLIWFDL